jgi:hypothetical protein
VAKVDSRLEDNLTVVEVLGIDDFSESAVHVEVVPFVI